MYIDTEVERGCSSTQSTSPPYAPACDQVPRSGMRFWLQVGPCSAPAESFPPGHQRDSVHCLWLGVVLPGLHSAH